MKVNLDMITDEQRVLYKLFELKVSILKVWSEKTLIYYSEQLCFNRALPKGYADVDDDPHQMGGNFIVEFNTDNSFNTIYSYRSRIPPDRPTSNEIIKFLKEN